MPRTRTTHVTVDGRDLDVTNLDKVLYPETGLTKAEVINYYVQIAPVLLPHLADRPITFRRFPDGPGGPSFYEKNCPGHRPPWVPTCVVHHGRTTVEYCLLAEPAALAWSANLAALELHPTLSRSTDPLGPTGVVFDLDPGPPAGVLECARVAIVLREILDGLGLSAAAKTSGSKGLHVQVPLNTATTFDDTKLFAAAMAELLAQRLPDLVVTTMAKDRRVGRVFVDWSQNSQSKTTVAVYSLRAVPRATVSTPVMWDEVADALVTDTASVLSFDTRDVLERVRRHGDLWTDYETLPQQLPRP